MISLKTIKNNILNIPGSRFKKKIVVIESDDWGTIRMSSKDAYNSLLRKGYPVDKCPYNSNDCLESNSDLENLFEVLSSVKGSDGNPAVMTVNNIVANPNFDKIRESKFTQYCYEPFTETLKRYPAHDKVMELYRQGIQNKIVKPQFHGREHLNVKRWMNALRRDSKAEKDAFDFNIFSAKISQTTGYTNEYMDAFDFNDVGELSYQEEVLAEGLKLFENIWKYPSKSFIAPCYIWHSALEKILKKHGVQFIQGLVNQFVPRERKQLKYKKKFHYQGQKNKNGQRYFIRNAFFEPSINSNFDWESDCLRRMEIAFSWRKPVIISSHRLNYIGCLNQKNSELNLKRLKNLLIKILNKWPEVQFKSTDQLGQLYDS